MPPALYEIGTAIVVAVALLPQLADSLRRVRAARHCAGCPAAGWAGCAGSSYPVMEDALERSMSLAAGMDARGYGRAGDLTVAQRRTTGALMLAGLVGICIGTYALLDQTAPRLAGAPRAGRRRGPRRGRLLVGRAPGAAEPLPAGPLALRGDRGVAERDRRRGRMLGGSRGDPVLHPPLDTCPTVHRSHCVVLLGRLAAVVAPPPVLAQPGRVPGRWPMLELRDITFSYPTPAARSWTGSTSPSRRVSWCSSPAAPASASPPCSACSTGWCLAFTGGRSSGDVLLDGASILDQPPRERAHVVGYVGQDPTAGFVTDTVEEELAYGMEQLGLAARRCGGGSRRRSTCSGSPTCAAVTCARSRAGSSSAWRSARC